MESAAEEQAGLALKERWVDLRSRIIRPLGEYLARTDEVTR